MILEFLEIEVLELWALDFTVLYSALRAANLLVLLFPVLPQSFRPNFSVFRPFFDIFLTLFSNKILHYP